MLEDTMISLARMWAEDSNLRVTVTDKPGVFNTKYSKKASVRGRRVRQVDNLRYYSVFLVSR